MKRNIAVDFDGTIVDFDYPRIGKVKEGVREALAKLRELGFHIIIYSCRACKWYPEEFPPEKTKQSFRQMVDFLYAHNIPFDEVDDGSKGKPYADYYIDDKGIRFENNWSDIANAIAFATIGKGIIGKGVSVRQDITNTVDWEQ